MADKYVVYSDGACAPTNPGPCAWGAVVIDEDGVIRNFKGFLGHGTNQIAEVSAALQGLLCTPIGADVELVSDSQYTLKGISEWRNGWIRRGWKNAAGDPIANKELWQRLFAAVDARAVRTRWVKGHNGNQYNEEADRLANAGLKCELGEVVEDSITIKVDPKSEIVQNLVAKPAVVVTKDDIDHLYILGQRMKAAAYECGQSNSRSVGYQSRVDAYDKAVINFEGFINKLHDVASSE